MAKQNSTSTLSRADHPAPTAPLPPVAVAAMHRLAVALIPAARLESAQAECRRRSAAAVTSEDYELLLCVQDELAMCRCLIGGA